MNRIIPLILLATIILVYPKPAHAIILLPAIILIPIAKIVALVIGGFALPSLGLGVLGSKLFGGSMSRILTYMVIFLMIMGLGLAIFLYIQNPDRPLF